METPMSIYERLDKLKSGIIYRKNQDVCQNIYRQKAHAKANSFKNRLNSFSQKTWTKAKNTILRMTRHNAAIPRLLKTFHM